MRGFIALLLTNARKRRKGVDEICYGKIFSVLLLLKQLNPPD